MWFFILTVALAAPTLEPLGWVGTTLVLSGVERVHYLPKHSPDGAALQIEEWWIKCILPADGTLQCWEFGGPHLAEQSAVKCIAPADKPLHCMDPNRPQEPGPDVTLGPEAAWHAWIEEHPLSIGGDVDPPTRSFGVVLIDKNRDQPEWLDGNAEFVLGLEGRGSYGIQLTRGDLTWTWYPTAQVTGGGVYAKTLDITPYWTRDGRHLAVFEHDRGGGEENESIPPTTRIHHASSTLITVLAPESLSPAVYKSACETVARESGLVFQNPQFSKRAAEESVVYFTEGYREQAEAVAKAVPGGAAVEPVSWRTHSKHIDQAECQHLCGKPDLILELGASVSRKGKPMPSVPAESEP